MKYVIPIRSHRVRSRVPGHVRSIHPSSPDPFTLSPRSHGLESRTRLLARRQPFHLSSHPTTGPLNPIQNP